MVVVISIVHRANHVRLAAWSTAATSINSKSRGNIAMRWNANRTHHPMLALDGSKTGLKKLGNEEMSTLFACFSKEIFSVVNCNTIKHQGKDSSNHGAHSNGYERIYRRESRHKTCHKVCKNVEENWGKHH
jgi:hypothetical protein